MTPEYDPLVMQFDGAKNPELMAAHLRFQQWRFENGYQDHSVSQEEKESWNKFKNKQAIAKIVGRRK